MSYYISDVEIIANLLTYSLISKENFTFLQELRQKAHTELVGFSRGMNGACVAKMLQFEHCSDTIYL